MAHSGSPSGRTHTPQQHGAVLGMHNMRVGTAAAADGEARHGSSRQCCCIGDQVLKYQFSLCRMMVLPCTSLYPCHSRHSLTFDADASWSPLWLKAMCHTSLLCCSNTYRCAVGREVETQTPQFNCCCCRTSHTADIMAATRSSTVFAVFAVNIAHM